MSGVTFYREPDADPAALSGTCVAVLGYGNLGRSMALNLRDSGLDVVVGNIDDDYRRQAHSSVEDDERHALPDESPRTDEHTDGKPHGECDEGCGPGHRDGRDDDHPYACGVRDQQLPTLS